MGVILDYRILASASRNWSLGRIRWGRTDFKSRTLEKQNLKGAALRATLPAKGGVRGGIWEQRKRCRAEARRYMDEKKEKADSSLRSE
jgi:hypothetical protein